MRAEYKFDYSKSKPNRFARHLRGDTVAVVLDPEVASVFDSSESVNSILRPVARAVRRGEVARRSSISKTKRPKSG